MKGVFVKPLETFEEVKQLDLFRRDYWDADLELPHDFKSADGRVDTAVATKGGVLLGSLTGVDAVVLDPFIKNPNASPLELLFALIKMETALTFNAQKRGAVDAYIAVPKKLKKYIKLLENYGYHPTVQNCVVLRRPLRPELVALIGPERDKLLKEQLEKEEKSGTGKDTLE